MPKQKSKKVKFYYTGGFQSKGGIYVTPTEVLNYLKKQQKI